SSTALWRARSSVRSCLWRSACTLEPIFSVPPSRGFWFSLPVWRHWPYADRGRTAIVFGGVMVGGVGYAANMLGLRFCEPYWLFQIYANVSVIVVSLSLAYAVLRHRVFDVAFVLNRTLVFALTSALVLVVFAALEFVADRFLTDVSHVEGMLLQFG